MDRIPEFATALGGELGVLADGEAPPSAVSAAEAVQLGKSRLRRRRLTVVGAVAAIAVTAGALTALRPDDGRGAVPAGPHPTSFGSPSFRPTTVSPRPSGTFGWQNLPLYSDARFGWLPDGVTNVKFMMTPWGPVTQAKGWLGGPNSSPFLTMKVYPAGVTPRLDDFPQGRKAIRVDAAPVNGREAYWVSSTDADYASHLSLLRWKAADGRWAELNSTYLSDADRLQVPLRIAADVTVGTATVPLPFRVSGVPAGAELGSGTVEMPVNGGTSWSAVTGVVLEPGQSVSISVQTENPSTAPALPSSGAPVGPPRICTSDRGVRVCVWTGQDPESVFAPWGGADGLLKAITVLGGDPGKWTTNALN